MVKKEEEQEEVRIHSLPSNIFCNSLSPLFILRLLIRSCIFVEQSQGFLLVYVCRSHREGNGVDGDVLDNQFIVPALLSCYIEVELPTHHHDDIQHLDSGS